MGMSDTEKEILLEVIKTGLALYANYAKTKGMTEEELDKVYVQSKKDFYLNDPKNLEEV